MSKKKNKKQDPLTKFVKEKEPRAKSIYTMVKFDRFPNLLDFMLGRCEQLDTDKQNYIIALIRQDMDRVQELGAQNEKR